MHVQRAAATLACGNRRLHSRSSAAPAPWLRSSARRIRWRCSRPSTPRDSAFAFGRKGLADLIEEERRLGGRRKLLQARPACPAASTSPDPRTSCLQPARLVQDTRPSRSGHQRGRLQQFSEHEAAHGTRRARPRWRVVFDFRARRFHQASVLHARRAGASRSRGRPGTDRCARYRKG